MFGKGKTNPVVGPIENLGCNAVRKRPQLWSWNGTSELSMVGAQWPALYNWQQIVMGCRCFSGKRHDWDVWPFIATQRSLSLGLQLISSFSFYYYPVQLPLASQLFCSCGQHSWCQDQESHLRGVCSPGNCLILWLWQPDLGNYMKLRQWSFKIH